MSSKVIATLLFILGLFAAMPSPGFSASPRQLVAKGNAAYREGKYDEALSAYEEAAVVSPESACIYYNKGTALYRKGDYRAAADAFKKAAVKSKDVSLEARSRFNLGNCAFREARRQQDSDLNKALEACTRSVRHYQEALDLVPDFKEAAENIEVVRLVMKDLLDRINKQKQAAEAQARSGNQVVEKLKDLIRRQKDILGRNRKIQEKQDHEGDSPELREQMNGLVQGQKDLEKETEKLAKKLADLRKQNGTPDKNDAQKHLDRAAEQQKMAAENLARNHLSRAQTNQETAVRELDDARSSLEKGSGSLQNRSPRGAGKNAKQHKAANAGKGDHPRQRDNGNSSAMARLSDDAHGILDEEKENRKKRRLLSSGGFVAVDKDW